MNKPHEKILKHRVDFNPILFCELITRNDATQSKPSARLGSSLIELMMSVFLATFMITALIEHYLFAKKHHLHIQNTLEEALEVQLVQNIIRNSIRSAGFSPCLRVDRLISRDSRNHQPLLPIKINSESSQEITLFRMDSYFYNVLDFSNPKQLRISNSMRYKKNQLILISDCYHAEVHQIANVQTYSNYQLIDLKNALHFQYEKPTYIGEWIEETFYIKKNRFKPPTLYYRHREIEELASTIHSLSTTLFSQAGKIFVKISLNNSNNPRKQCIIESMIRAN